MAGKHSLNGRSEKDKIEVVKLSLTDSGDVYSITTSAVVRKDYTNKKELLWKSEPTKEATTTSSNLHTISPSSFCTIKHCNRLLYSLWQILYFG